jgi:hypothetical protein
MSRFLGTLPKLTSLAAAILVLLVGPAVVMAQDVANGTATATVLTALTVTATAPLAFGNVLQGVPKSVAKDDAAAGIFTINGAANAGVAMYMQLPDYVVLADGSDRMVIAFGITDANVDTTGGGDPTAFVAADGYIDQNPHNLPNGANLSDAGAANIFLGGRVVPTVDQTAGAYSGEIVLTVAYNGS